MPTAVVTTTFLAPVGLWQIMAQADELLVEACETYQKRSFRQRSYLMGPNGLLLLSVPLASGKHTGQPIKEVKISYEHDWIGPMLHAIRSALGSAPYFDYYYGGIEKVFRSRHETLWSLNTSCNKYIEEAIGLSLDIAETTRYTNKYDQGFDHRGYRHKPTQNPDMLYEQVWMDRHGYWQDLSVLDLLFCVGPEALLFLRR